jgi:hypothetical protein
MLARAHHDAVRAALRAAKPLRSLLREFVPAALEAFPSLYTRTAVTVLAQDVGSGVGSSDADVVEASVVAQRDHAGAEDRDELDEQLAAQLVEQPARRARASSAPTGC